MSKEVNSALLKMNLAVFLWGFTGILGRAISVGEYPLVIYRILFTLFFLYIILLYKKKLILPCKKDLIKFAGIGSIIAVHWVFFYGAIKLANASIALVCLSTAGVFTILVDAVWHKTKIKAIELLLGLMAILGMYIIYSTELKFSIGIIFGVIAAIMSGVFTIMNKKIIDNYLPQTVMFYEFSFGVVTLSILLPVYKYFMPNANTSFAINTKDVLLLLALSYGCTVWGQALALDALKKLSSFTTVLLVNLEPVYGIILANIFYKENKEVGTGFYIGIVIIALSVLIHIYAMRKEMKKIS